MVSFLKYVCSWFSATYVKKEAIIKSAKFIGTKPLYPFALNTYFCVCIRAYIYVKSYETDRVQNK